MNPFTPSYLEVGSSVTWSSTPRRENGQVMVCTLMCKSERLGAPVVDIRDSSTRFCLQLHSPWRLPGSWPPRRHHLAVASLHTFLSRLRPPACPSSRAHPLPFFFPPIAAQRPAPATTMADKPCTFYSNLKLAKTSLILNQMSFSRSSHRQWWKHWPKKTLRSCARRWSACSSC